jgi:hypothetical protein
MKRAVIIGLVVLTGAYCWLISYGTMSLSHAELRGAAYDSLGEHLIRGSAEVDPKAIESESFVENGRTFMYFGPFPAILRIIPNEILPSMQGNWSRWSCLLAGLLSVAAFIKIISERTQKYAGHIRSRLIFAATVGFAFGTPVFFLLSCAFIYHEAVIWGLCWSLWGLWYWLRADFSNPRLDDLIGLSACAGFAILSRVTFGIPLLILLAISMIFWFIRQFQKTTREPLALLSQFSRICLPAAGCLAFQAWYNWARFSSALVFIDTAHHTSLNIAPISYQNRLAELGLFNIGRLWIGLNNYLGFDPSYFLSHMPFISVARVRLDSVHYPIGYIEWTLPLILCSPWIILLGLIGFESLVTKSKWLDLLSVTILAIPAFIVCIFYFLTQRYSAEFIPPFVFLGAIGAEQVVRSVNTPSLQKLTVVSIEVLCVLSILATILSTFGWNANYNWAAPKEYQNQILTSFERIDKSLGIAPR